MSRHEESSAASFWTHPIIKNVFAGASYGATAVVLSHPFDTLKTRQQASGRRDAIRVVTSSIAKEGPFFLYKGFVPALSGSIAFRTLPFVAYQWSTTRLNETSNFFRDHTTVRACAAGASGGFLRSLVECPLEVAKVRRQVNAGWNVRALYDGLLITVLRNTTVIGLFWGLADVVRPECERRAIEGPLCSFIIGGGCSTVAWAIIYPLDVIKSRVQGSYVIGEHRSCSARTRSSRDDESRRILSVVRTMFAGIGGWRSFYAGLHAGLLRSVVANGGAFVVYDYVRTRLF